MTTTRITDLTQLSNTEVLRAYNALAGANQVKRFADKSAGVKRLTRLLAETGAHIEYESDGVTTRVVGGAPVDEQRLEQLRVEHADLVNNLRARKLPVSDTTFSTVAAAEAAVAKLRERITQDDADQADMERVSAEAAAKKTEFKQEAKAVIQQGGETPPVAAKKSRQTGGQNIAWYTQQYNELVPEAQSLGIKAKHHTSLFESKAKGEAQLAKLQAAISAARK